MKNNLEIVFDVNSGGLAQIKTCPEMSFCESMGNKWGTPKWDFPIAFNRNSPMRLISSDAETMSACFTNDIVNFSVVRAKQDGCIFERFIVTNICNETIFTNDGDLSVYTPFNDSYEAAQDCLEKRCHAHINCCGSSTSVLLMRMGDYDNNLGLALTSGIISSYSVENPPYSKNDRGDILLDIAGFVLEPGEKYEFEWVLFECKDEKEFNEKRLLFGQCLVECEAYNLFLGESIKMKVRMLSDSFIIRFFINGKETKEEITNGTCEFTYMPEEIGEYTVCLKTSNRIITSVFYVSPILETLSSARVHFISKKQQYNCQGSRLDGAYLIYDNTSKTQYYSPYVSDHNAFRERIGMGLLVVKWLQSHDDDSVRSSLDKYIRFVLREMVDEESGYVFDSMDHDINNLRLYNAPWVCNFFCELYRYTGNSRWAILSFKIMEAYYKNEGNHFYPNAYSPVLPVTVLKDAGLTNESKLLIEYSENHARTIISNGIYYPKHEVDYEQTIVAPAATILLGTYELTGDDFYLEAAKPHISLLLRFNSHGYDYHLYENSIRHWDDFWFGKGKTFGDTFPHYWSVLSGYAFECYGVATDDMYFLKRADDSIRGSLCLFNADGSASCAFVFPKKINGKNGSFFDAWSNDQDFALYYALLHKENKKND